MSEFIAESVIIIKANTKPFVADLARVAKAAEKTPVTITVRASMQGFRTDLIQKLKTSSRGVTVSVLVRPDMTGFRAELIAQTKRAARGVVVPVTVTPGRITGAAAAAGAAAGAAGAAGAGDVARQTARATAETVKQTAAEKALAEATNASAFARKRVLGDLTAQEKSVAILAREEASLRAAEKAVTAAVAEQNVQLEAQARALVQTQRAAVERRRGVIARREEQLVRPERAAQQQRAALITQANAIEQERQQLLARGEAAQTKIVEREQEKRVQIERAFSEREAELRASRTQGVEQALERERKTTIAEGERVLGARAAQDDRLFRQRARLEQRLGVLQRRTAALRVQGVGAEEISLERRRAADIQRVAREAASEARRANLPTLAAELELLDKQNAEIREQLLLQQRLNRLRERAALAVLPQTGRTQAAGLTKEAAANARAAAAAEQLVADARRANVATIAAQAAVIQRSTSRLAEERGEVAKTTRELEIGTRTRRDVRRATQAQLLTFAGLRGAALSAESAFLFAAAGTIAFVKAIQSAVAFETELNTFQATAGATADEMERVEETAKALGRDLTLPGVSAHDAAEALTELSKAGLSVEDSIDGARGVLQLATAASIENAQATELAASALNAFGLAGDQATHVADVFANAANAAQGSIVDIATAQQQSSAVVRQAGLTFEQGVTALTLFARAGLKGSDAGTSLRTMLIRLINPTTKAQKVIDQLGLHIRDATGAINLGVFDEFRRKTQNLTAAQRDQALAVIFGQDAIRGAAILVRTGSIEFDRLTKQLNKSGTASLLAGARTKGLGGAFENLRNQLSDAATGLGQSLIPGLTDLANLAADVVGGVRVLATEIKGLANDMDSAVDETNRFVGELRDLARQAVEPIDVVVNIIENVIPGDGERTEEGEERVGPPRESVQGRVRAIFSLEENAPELITDAKELGIEASAALQDVVDKTPIRLRLITFPTIADARQQIRGLLDELNKDPGSTQLNQTVTDLIKIRDEMARGTFGSKEFARSLTPFIARLQRLSTLPIELPPIKFPRSLEAGARAALESSGNEAGIITAEEFSKGFLPSFTDLLEGAGKSLEEAFGPAARAAAAQIKKEIAEALRPAARAEGQARGFSRAETQARIRGDVEGQIQALEGVAAAQRRIIAAVNKATGGAPAGKQLERRTEAEETLASTLERIQSLEEQQAAKVKEKADKIKEARDEADQAFLDALVPAQRRIERRLTRAEGTPQLEDDRRALIARRALLQREIALIDQHVKDRKEAADQIADRTQEILEINNRIADLRTQILEGAATAQEEAFTARQGKLERRQNIAEQFGDITAQRRIITVRIKEYDRLIRDFKGERSALDEVKAERDALVRERSSLRGEQLEAQVDLAQSIFDLTENRNPLLRALNAQIAGQRKQIAAAKRAGRSTTLLRTELNKMLLRRKEVLEDAKEDADKEHTTAFDLLKQFSDTFNQIGGNLINAQQPFAGPTGFTADIAQFLRRQEGPKIGFTSEKQQLELSDRLLIQALERLTEATIENTGTRTGRNTSTASGTTADIPHGANRSDIRFYRAAQQRGLEEGV